MLFEIERNDYKNERKGLYISLIGYSGWVG